MVSGASTHFLSHFLKHKRTIVLVGMMGVGKSSVGWRLAKRLNVPFFDSDREVEAAAGCSISDIYALWGENAFKEAEAKVIKRLLEGPPHVLSTGDGSFVRDELRELMLEKAICIWLKADVDTIYERVKHRKTRPQLLLGDTRDILEKLVTERHAFYQQAPCHVESQDEAHDITVERMLESLRLYQESIGGTF